MHDIERIRLQQGWNDASMVVLLLRFIDQADANDALIAFLQAQADEENDEEGDDEP